MNQKKSGLTDISRVIDNWFEGKNYTKRRTNFSAFNNWSEIVGDNIAKHTKPVKFYNDTLVIHVRNSVWTQELQFLKPSLLEKIKNSFPDTQIKDLMFKIGKITHK